MPRATWTFVRRLLNSFLPPRLSCLVRRRVAVARHRASVSNVWRGATSRAGSAFRARLPVLLPPEQTRGAQRRFVGLADGHPAPRDRQGSWCLKERRREGHVQVQCSPGILFLDGQGEPQSDKKGCCGVAAEGSRPRGFRCAGANGKKASISHFERHIPENFLSAIRNGALLVPQY